MASTTVHPVGSLQQVGKEKTFSLDEESGLHVMNRVREYKFTPDKQGLSEPAMSGRDPKMPKAKKAMVPPGSTDLSSGAAEAAGTATDVMRQGSIKYPVAAAGGALALAVLGLLHKGRKGRSTSNTTNENKADAIPASSSLVTPVLPAEPSTSVEFQSAELHMNGIEEALSKEQLQLEEALNAGPREVVSIVDSAASTAPPVVSSVEEPEEWPEPGTPRSIRTVSSAGGGSMRSLSADESQSQRLASHRKEVVMKLRQQLQSRDEFILDIQQQLAKQEHFCGESRTIIKELELQLKQAVEGGQKLGEENRALEDQVQRLEKLAGERDQVVEEKKQLDETVASLEQEGDQLEERIIELENARKDLDQERDRLRAIVDEQKGALQSLELERDRLRDSLIKAEKALSDAEARLKSSESGAQGKETGPPAKELLAEKERLAQELRVAQEERKAKAALEEEAAQKAKAVEKDLERLQKMVRGKDRLIEGYEKERTHLTAAVQDLERKVQNLESAQQVAAATATEDVQSSNDSDGPTTMVGSSPRGDDEVESRLRGPRNMHLMKSFDNPLSELSPDASPISGGRPMSVSKPERGYDSRLLDGSVYPSPNGVLDMRPRQLNVEEHRHSEEHHHSRKPSADPDVSQLRSDVDALAQELSDRFRTVTEKKIETARLVQDLQRHNELIVDLQRKIGKEEELGLGEDDWLTGEVIEEEDSYARQAEGTAQAAILAKKLEQVALQQEMDERLAEIHQEETEISRLKGRVASLGGKVLGTEKVEPSAVFEKLGRSDVLGQELARKLAFQEEQATDGLAEVQRLSANFQRGSPLFAKAQDELVRKSLSALDFKAGRMNGAGNAAGQRSAGEAYEKRYRGEDAAPATNGFGKHLSENHVDGANGLPDPKYPNGQPVNEEHKAAFSSDSEVPGLDSETVQGVPQDEFTRLAVEVERELSQDFGKLDNGDMHHETRSQGTGEMDVEKDGEESVDGDEIVLGEERVSEERGSSGHASLAEMLESTLDDMVRMCTPAESQASSPFPGKRVK